MEPLARLRSLINARLSGLTMSNYLRLHNRSQRGKGAALPSRRKSCTRVLVRNGADIQLEQRCLPLTGAWT